MARRSSGDPAELQRSADNTADCLGELETDLKKLAGLQDDFGNALKSPAAGMAVQNAMGNAWQSGKSLGSTLQDVITVLKQHGTNVHAQDLEGQSRVNAAIGGDGHLDVGQWNPTPKVDTNSWA